ncbi:MAG: cytochrome c [Saprospiraceae bacterium]|nr:cytochrome c [Saprospiraceae bacterium]
MKFIILVLFFCLACLSSKFEYLYPPNLNPNDISEFDDFIKRGRKLYVVNCSSCHGKIYKSMDGQDRFSEEQIRNYAVNLKIRNVTHKFTQEMSMDDIDAICVYLKYRK